MYKSKELESIFIEIIYKKGKNAIVGSIYKHPKLAIDEFNNHFLAPMLKKVSFENKEVYLMDDFNINLLNYESNQETADFLNNMHSVLYLFFNWYSLHARLNSYYKAWSYKKKKHKKVKAYRKSN